MAEWLWYFWIYSFLGYLLEKVFAAATRADSQVRRCFLWFPMCPVYGLAMLAVLALPEQWRQRGWLFLGAGVVTTAVEYAVHWMYERFLGVQFWDYSQVRGNWNGRICLPFSLAWSVLAVFALRFLHLPVMAITASVPVEVTYIVLLLFSMDGILTARLLYRTGTISCLE